MTWFHPEVWYMVTDMPLHKTVLFVIGMKDECHWAESLRVPQKYYAYVKLALNVKISWAKHIKKLKSNAANFQLFAHLWDIALTCRWKSNKELESILSHHIKIWDRLSILAGFHHQALYNLLFNLNMSFIHFSLLCLKQSNLYYQKELIHLIFCCHLHYVTWSILFPIIIWLKIHIFPLHVLGKAVGKF